MVSGVSIDTICSQRLHGHRIPPAVATEAGGRVVAAALSRITGAEASNLTAGKEEADVFGGWVVLPVVLHETVEGLLSSISTRVDCSWGVGGSAHSTQCAD